jgi:hypothetical protein
MINKPYKKNYFAANSYQNILCRGSHWISCLFGFCFNIPYSNSNPQIGADLSLPIDLRDFFFRIKERIEIYIIVN